MGCNSSRLMDMQIAELALEVERPVSPSSSHSDIPIMPLASPSMGPASVTPASSSVLPVKQRLRRRRRQEPRLDHHLSDRLEPLAEYLEDAPRGSQQALYALTQRAVDDLLDNMEAFFLAYAAEKRTLVRLAQTGRVVQQIESFHRALDALIARCGLDADAGESRVSEYPSWQSRWRRMRAERLVFFRSQLNDRETAAAKKTAVSTPSDQLEILTLLKYDARKFESVLNADELELLERAFTFVAGGAAVADGSGKANNNHLPELMKVPLPDWFVAPYEKTKQQLKWQRAAVTVQKAPVGLGPQACLELAETWSRLRHPHIMKMFGACHVGRERFFVVANGTPLTRCFGDEGFPLWRALYETALALRFLHERQVALAALSCEDLVLFSSDGRDVVMLAGFNLRLMESKSTQNEEEDPVYENDSDDELNDEEEPEKELPRDSRKNTSRKWQAPECLESDGRLRPTVASDIFALGMCVIEAFSGGDVWGQSHSATPNVDNGKQKLLGRQLPPQPKALQDAWQWALVERMCAFDPEERPSLAEVLASFQVFAEEEEATNTLSAPSRPKKRSHPQPLRDLQPRATVTSIASALSEVQAWCDEASESSALNFQLYERFEDVTARLQGSPMVGKSEEHASALRALGSLTTRFRDSLQRNAREKPLLRMVASRQVVATNLALHGELDLIMHKLGLECNDSSIHRWVQQQTANREQLWRRMRASLAVDPQTLNTGLDGGHDLALFAAFLAFETSKRSSSYTSSDLQLLQDALVKIHGPRLRLMDTDPRSSHKASFGASVELPPWFIPPYEVVFDELNAFSGGSFGYVYVGKWLVTPVVVKEMLTPDEQGVGKPLAGRAKGSKLKRKSAQLAVEAYQLFLNEVNVWFSLKHPHVVKLYGACHVGPRQFFVCEYANLGPLNSYLASKSNDERDACAWRRLHEAGLGLQHLHEQNVVHADLKCSNILVGTHGVAKLTDFNLRSVQKRRLSRKASIPDSGGEDVEGLRWKAPEVLSGGSASFASDVYSFAMCIIEAVSGELPWGSDLPDAAVRLKVRNGLLPPRPKGCFSDRQWDLVERMCRHEPSERLTIPIVVDLMAVML